MNAKILIADDESDIVSMLGSFFESKGFRVLPASNGAEALKQVEKQPDIILLDINMPGTDGLEVCKRIRDHISCPILFLTARIEDTDKVNGFAVGGDDYIVKPFSLMELEARVCAHLRREARHNFEAQVKFSGDLTIDYSERCLFFGDKRVGLAKKEFDIVELLSQNPGQVFDKERIYERIWGYDSEGDSSVVAEHKVVNLSDVFGKDDATKRFVTRYLQTTHCDLFFADGAILVEGSAEHMLLPHFIRNKYLKLNQRYITILNINGKHSHRLAPLINKLALPTLVIADLDSAEPTGHHKKAEPVRKQGLISGNYAITDWLIKKKLLDDLIDLPDSDKVFSMQSICPYQIRIAYQTPIKICYQNKEIEALSRTFEDSLIYSNWDTFKGMSVSDPGQLIKKLKEGLDNEDSFETIKSKIFESLKQSDVKAEFALDLIYSIDPNMMVVPQYIDKGLKWLEDLLCEEG